MRVWISEENWECWWVGSVRVEERKPENGRKWRWSKAEERNVWKKNKNRTQKEDWENITVAETKTGGAQSKRGSSTEQLKN